MTGEELAMSGTLMWEPIVQPMTAAEFHCLVKRMLDRLAAQGWQLVRTDDTGRRPNEKSPS